MRFFSMSLMVLAGLFSVLPNHVSAADIVKFRVEDTIQPASRQFIERALSEAAARGADLAVMELDTPGGLLDSTREITTAITGSKIPVVVFVAPAGARAASAGFFILMAADVASMAPGTNTGAAHPVSGQGQEIGEHMEAKVTNDASAMIRSLAEGRNRNPEKAVEAVVESSSYTATEALELGLIDFVVHNIDSLIEELDGTTITRFDGEEVVLNLADPVIVVIDPTPAEEFLSVLANPNIAYLLMALGMLGIYVEVTHPGAIFPGVVGVIAMLLALYSLSVLPVSLAGVALIVVGLVLFLLEVKVTSYGLLTVGGLISFVLGSLMLFDSPVPDMRVSLGVILPTAFLVALVTGFLLSRVLRAHHRRPMTGVQGMVGETGRVVQELNPRGKVAVHGEWWDARSSGGGVPVDAEVKVLAIVGRHLEVEPLGVVEEEN
ncbi:MAG: nodulation protein NfeD [Thermoanaerobaculales bacterium]|nr:nodulation protein NfeD [Thermoanaerobaculales bacterium]